jgi:cytochrome c-type biogenesis protein CcmH/NrfG
LGLAAVLFPRRNSAPREVPITANKPALIVVGGLLLIGLVFALANRSAIISRYESNRGALEMARVELAGYPTNAWTDGSEVAQLSGAETRFAEAVQLDPRNRTAWHRLGLLAMMRRDYGVAADYLHKARELDPAHRGITKALAYSEIWSGQVAEGVRLLATVPEAQSELGVYAWWWDTQEHPELGQLAAEALVLLNGEAPTP